MKRFYLILIFVCLFFLNGCSNSNALNGTWESNTLILQFDNNQGVISVGSISNYSFGTTTTLYDYYFDYSTSDGELTLIITGSDSPYDTLERYGTIKMDYVISGDQLTVSNIQLGPNTYPDPIILTRISSETINTLNKSEESKEESSYESRDEEYQGSSLINLVEYVGKPLTDFEEKIEIAKSAYQSDSQIDSVDVYYFGDPNNSNILAGEVEVNIETEIIERLTLYPDRSSYNIEGIFVGMDYQTALEIMEKSCNNIENNEDWLTSTGVLKSNPNIEIFIKQVYGTSDEIVQGVIAQLIN